MIDYLIHIDEQLLLLLNGLHNAFFDPFWKAFSGKLVWAPMYVALAYAIIRSYGWRRGLVLVAAIGLAIGCSDIVAAKLIRPIFERLRPANLENPLSQFVHIVDGYRGGRYGFPSCHAANTFALALSSSLIARSRAYAVFIFCWAALQCYSRIHLGVHYPGDLLAGAIVGSAFAAACFFAVRKLNAEGKPFEAAVPVSIGGITIVLIVIFAMAKCFLP